MSRVMFLVLMLASPVAAQELPPGAVARVGEDRFRIGAAVKHLTLSADGKQFTTTHSTERTTWDGNTGLPLRTEKARAEQHRAELVKTGTGKFAVHVFDGSERTATLDLGAEGANALRLTEDGATVLVFRKTRPRAWTATAWDVGTGKPQPPVAVPATDVLILAPKGDALVIPTQDAREWGTSTASRSTPRAPSTRLKCCWMPSPAVGWFTRWITIAPAKTSTRNAQPR